MYTDFAISRAAFLGPSKAVARPRAAVNNFFRRTSWEVRLEGDTSRDLCSLFQTLIVLESSQ